MDKSAEEEELEPLFDYTRVQPIDISSLEEEDCYEAPFPKRKKFSQAPIIDEKASKGPDIVNLEDENEEDWLPPPPKVSDAAKNFEEDSTIKQLRLKKQELASVAQSAEDVLRAVEESAQKDTESSLHSLQEIEVENASKPHDQRAKIIISIQDKDGPKQFRVFKDEMFEKILSMYAEKVQRDMTSLVFCFDGDKINLAATPGGLDMEDGDIIEVHMKSS